MGGGWTVASGWHLLGGGVATLWFDVRWLWDGWECMWRGQQGFLDVSVDKMAFLCFLIFICEFLVDGTGWS